MITANGFSELPERILLITFDISVNLPLRMKVLQTFQYFPQYSSYVSLFKRSWAELQWGNKADNETKIKRYA